MKVSEALTLALVLGGGLVLSAWLRTQSPPGLAEQAATLRVLAQHEPIDMISSETCPYCKRAREWFTEHQVPFKECFVERDAACKKRWQQTGARATPTFVVGNKTVLGLDPVLLIQLMNQRQAPD